MKKFQFGLMVFLLLYLGSGFIPPKSKSPYDVQEFSLLPVQEGGRNKPVDSLARNSLLVISGKQTLRVDNTTKSAAEWLLDVLFKPTVADEYEIFEIDDPDVRGLLGIEPGVKRRFAYSSFAGKLREIDEQAQKAEQIKTDKRDRFQRSILDLFKKIALYHRLQSTLRLPGETMVMPELIHTQEELPMAIKAHAAGDTKFNRSGLALFFNRANMLSQSSAFAPIPMGKTETGEWVWASMGDSLMAILTRGEFSSMVMHYTQLGDAYANDSPEIFNQVVRKMRTEMSTVLPDTIAHSQRERFFNQFAPFIKSMALYILVFLIVPFSWMFSKEELRKTSTWVLLIACIIHTAGLLARMILQGRPPVTNLYSSAIFVGWVAVLLSLVMEKLFKNGIGNFVGSLIGFSTLIIAHHLATQGDTLEMMRAVLDSNFWLATHVVTITVGYSSTFLSGFMGALYLVRRAFDKTWNKNAGENLIKMVFGVVCFSAFFSFLGTILGGIWADQSWGRFWGWDPKENGALMIVLWNVIILHTWWGRLAKEESLMAMAVFGNVITALSWFGVNMLGIGLHSYGFMDKAFWWLMIFTATQLALMALRFLKPRSHK